MTTWRDYLFELSPPRLRQWWGESLVGVFGTMADLISQAASEALRASWVKESVSPDDALLFIGGNFHLPRYPGESASDYRARLATAWDLWQLAGDEQSIDGQIAAAGLSGSVHIDPSAPGPGLVTPWLSQFWILTSETDPDALATMMAIARKWKPVRWIVRAFIFDFSSPAGAIAERAIGDEAIGGAF